MKTLLWIILLAVFLFLTLGDAIASELRCGSRLVSIGDHRYDVLRKCGEPVNVETWEEVRIRRGLLLSFPLTPEQEIFLQSPLARELVTIEEWQYNFGQSQFIRYLRFENGRLRRIVTGDYGY
ncbi:MAG: hypothetical protein A2V86_12075 [Deltaproteobacteria bacterium RBG_16_49_23]|nr:MAG: hypothetical protein A2V86_12075 [Deltaproteobacteria bacterium RBG_16_49_23]